MSGKTMTRAERRATLARRKHQVARMIRWVWQYRTAPEDWLCRTVGIRAHTRSPCSCYACGHTRAISGPTLQERRADLKRELRDMRAEEDSLMTELRQIEIDLGDDDELDYDYDGYEPWDESFDDDF